MFALIETKGATHIAIHVPTEGSHASLPALAKMLEGNAIFINKSWREINVVTPEMSIVLGEKFVIDGDTEALVVAPSKYVIGDEFVTSTPEVLTSNRAAMAKKEAEIKRLQTELSGTKAMLEQANAQVRALTESAHVDGD